MNVLEHYIVEIHSVEPYKADWTREFPDREFVEVDVTHDCYGSVVRQKEVWNTVEFEQYKKDGYWLG